MKKKTNPLRCYQIFNLPVTRFSHAFAFLQKAPDVKHRYTPNKHCLDKIIITQPCISTSSYIDTWIDFLPLCFHISLNSTRNMNTFKKQYYSKSCAVTEPRDWILTHYSFNILQQIYDVHEAHKKKSVYKPLISCTNTLTAWHVFCTPKYVPY